MQAVAIRLSIRSILAVLAVAIASAVPAHARADAIYGFTHVTSNNPQNVAAGERQLFVSVFDASSANANRVGFSFVDVGPTPLQIAGVQFDGASLLGSSGVTPLDGTTSPSASGTGGAIGGRTSYIDRLPLPSDGGDPPQPTTVMFDLLDGHTYSDAIAALDRGALGSALDVGGTSMPSIRITLNAVFGGGGSEMFANGEQLDAAAAPAPAPAEAIALLGAVLLGARVLRRRHNAVRAVIV